MIRLIKLSKEEVVINADLVETIEATPDTIITLTTNRKITVRDSVEEVVKKIIQYKQLTNQTIGIVPKQERLIP